MSKKIIHYAFERIANLKKDHIAVQTETANISYEALNIQSNKLADLLSKRAINKGDITAAFLNNSLVQLVSLLGIFKTGSIYLPLDKKYNQNHWESLFTDIQPKALIISEENFDLLYKYDDMFLYTIPEVIAAYMQEDGTVEYVNYIHNGESYETISVTDDLSIENPTVELDENDSNYIFFTSGSTGKPKAVLGKHKSLHHFISWVTKEFDITETERIGLLASFSFDASLHDIFAAFSNGATLFIPSAETKEDIAKLQNWIQRESIGILHMVPTLFRVITNSVFDENSETLSFPKLKYMLLAGEKLFKKDVIAWRTRFGVDTEIVNLYGTTETTCLSTINRIKDEDEGNPSEVFGVGQPISNTMILILNANNQLCRVNEVGSVYIRTPFTTKGYYNDEALTNEKFVQNPLTDKKDIIYRTGDYGQYDAARNVTILGREDGIVKISGVRIDINTIEKTILKLEAVDMVKCILNQDQDQNLSIACFFTSTTVDVATVNEHCAQFLSQYEVPSFIIKLDEFPINTNGKVDTAQLKQILKDNREDGSEIVAATNEIEEKLIDIWKEILEVEAVGIEDDFLLKGGNSIRLIKLKVKIHQALNVSLNINELFFNSKLKDQADLIIDATGVTFENIQAVHQEESYPLSSSQNRLWILSRFQGSSESYNMPSSLILNIEKVEDFKKSIHAIIERHEILRTVFKENENGEGRQHIIPAKDFDFTIQTIDYTNESNPQASAIKYVQEDGYKPFDLENGPILRIALLQLDTNTYVFYYNMHHIISDAKSMELLGKDVQSYYSDLLEGKTPELPELKIQYKDYAVWEAEELTKETSKEDQKYWTNYLSGNLPVLDLPGAKMRSKAVTHDGTRLSTMVSAENTALLKEYCQESGGTVFMGLLAVFSVLFNKYSNQKDIIIGSSIEGRDHIDLANQIGCYVNTLVHRNNVDGTLSFNEFFETVKKNVIASFDHQQYPFDKVLEDLSIERKAGRNALFDVMLTLQNTGDVLDDEEMTEDVKEGQITNNGSNLAQLDLVIDFVEIGNRMYFQIIYNSNIYQEEMIGTMMLHFQELMADLLKNPSQNIGRANYLSQAEQKELLLDFNATETAFSEETSFLDVFKSHVAKTPEAIAVKNGELEISYQELDELTDKFALYLKDTYSLKHGDFVVINIDRSHWLMISVLAIFKLGCAYIPVDTSYPEERKQYILNDSNCKNIIDGNFVASFLKVLPNITETLNTVKIAPEDLAYIIYTSGSTGNPKGVMIEHKGMMNHCYAMVSQMELNAESIIIQNAPYTFDISVWQLLNSLVVGGTTSIFDQETIFDSKVFLDRLYDEKPTILQVVPSYLKVLLDMDESSDRNSFEALNYLLVTGDTATKDLVTRWFTNYPNIKLVNAYGPAEASDDVTLHVMDSIPERLNISVGKPVQNMQVYVLDEHLALCGKGIEGEICVSGIGLAKGYLNRAELTAEKFVDHPFKKGEKLYKTGDMGMWLPDGTLEFHGRRDNQVKINGFRIELQEIEHQFLSKDTITETIVLAEENKFGEKELIAFIVSNIHEDVTSLRNYISDRIPDFMTPKKIIQLEALPLNANGKIDRKALLSGGLLESESQEADYVAPKNDVEEKIAEIIAEILDKEVSQISTEENFFDLGMNSITLIRTLTIINKTLQLKVKPSAMFEYPNIVEFTASQCQSLLENAQEEEYIEEEVNENLSEEIDSFLDLI